MADFGLSFRPDPPPLLHLFDERLVVQGQGPELPWRHVLLLAERVDVVNEISHEHGYRLDRPNPSSWIATTYPDNVRPWEKAAMEADFDFEPYRHALADAIKRSGVAPTTLSLRVGNNKSLVKTILDKGDDIKISTLWRLARAIGMDVGDLLPGFVRSPAEDRPWVPKPDTVTALMAAAIQNVSGGLSSPNGVEEASHIVFAGLRTLASHPEHEDDPKALRALIDTVSSGLDHEMTGKVRRA